jgi:hypothetical protein
MCYQRPVELLENLLEAVPLEPNDRGFTAMDDFGHFCAYTGCSEGLLGRQALPGSSSRTSTPRQRVLLADGVDRGAGPHVAAPLLRIATAP